MHGAGPAHGAARLSDEPHWVPQFAVPGLTVCYKQPSYTTWSLWGYEVPEETALGAGLRLVMQDQSGELRRAVHFAVIGLTTELGFKNHEPRVMAQVLRMVVRGQSDELRRALHFAVTGAVLRAPPARAFAAAIDAATEVGVIFPCQACCPNVRRS